MFSCPTLAEISHMVLKRSLRQTTDSQW